MRWIKPVMVLSMLLLSAPPHLSGDAPPDERGRPGVRAVESCYRGDVRRTAAYPADGVANAPRVRWTFTAEGRYLSSPVAAGAMLFLGDEEHLYALDRASGRLLWKQHLSGAGPSLIAGGVVFLGAGENALHAIVARSGVPRWKIMTGSVRPTSPALSGGLLLFGGGSFKSTPGDHGYLMAVDAETGEERWKFKTRNRITTPPAVLDGIAYAGFGDSGHILSGGQMFAIDAVTGVERWETPPLLNLSGSPAVSGDAVFFGVSGNASGALMAVSRWTGQHLWKITTGGSVHTPAVAGGVVYFGTSENQAGSFYAVDIATRKVLWEHHGTAWIDSPPTVAGNTVYVADNHGVLLAFDAKTGKQRWTFTAGRGQLYASTLPVGRTLYFAAGGILYALE